MPSSMNSSVVKPPNLDHLNRIHRITSGSRFLAFLAWQHCYKAMRTPSLNCRDKALHISACMGSYGMNRSNSLLADSNFRIHEDIVRDIEDWIDEWGTIDFHKIGDQFSRDKLAKSVLDLSILLKKHYQSVRDELGPPVGTKKKRGGATDTLVTKVLLCTIGATPAYDRYVRLGLKGVSSRTFGKKSLVDIYKYAVCNEEAIKICQQGFYDQTGYSYPLMRVLDMHFFALGADTAAEEKKLKE